jgi:hypothetical protein
MGITPSQAARFDPRKISVRRRVSSAARKLRPTVCGNSRLSSYHGHWFDNYRFIVHEFLLYFVAILIKHKLFDQVETFLGGGF